MSATQKDLKYYLEHTDEMPTDSKELERLANDHMNAALEAGTEEIDVDKIVGKADEKQGDAAPKDTEVETKPAEEPKVEKPEAADVKPDGILAKDGKNVIPYSQLENARQRAAAAEALARDQAQELTTLRAARTQPVVTQDADLLTEEELVSLEEDLPVLGKTLRMQQSAIRSLREQLQSVAMVQQNQAATQEQEVKSEIQTAIDANPTLAGWQTDQDQSLWNEASRFDRLLRESPAYANVSFENRFAKVVELTQSALGLEVEEPQKEVVLKPEEVRAAAQAKLTKVAKARRPTTLSDIPGGAPPAVDERQKVDEMSPTALGNQFLSMTKDQLDAYLTSL